MASSAERGTRTNFSYSLSKQISEARTLATIALDPNITSASVDPEKQYPPVLTPSQFAGQISLRSPNPLSPWAELMKARDIEGSLAVWTEEGYFDLIPLPHNRVNQTGYRLNSIGMDVAKQAIADAVGKSQEFLASLPE